VVAQVLMGRVVERGTDALIPDAIVVVTDSAGALLRSVRSNAQGRYRLTLANSSAVVLRVRRLGFRPFTSDVLHVGVGDTLRYDATLDEAPHVLSEVTIRDELERVRDLQYFGMSGRSIPATYITLSQIEAVGKDARNYVDIMRGLHLISFYIDEVCIHALLGGGCLAVYLDDRLLTDADPEMQQATRFVADPNEIDHMAYIRPGEQTAMPELKDGVLLIYTRKFTARQRKFLKRP
jgi:hypothetical protein